MHHNAGAGQETPLWCYSTPLGGALLVRKQENCSLGGRRGGIRRSSSSLGRPGFRYRLPRVGDIGRVLRWRASMVAN